MRVFIIFIAIFLSQLLPASVVGFGPSAGAGAGGGEESSDATADSPMVNAMCPVFTDEPVDLEYQLDYNGSRIAFCCQKCRRKFERNPLAYAEGLAEVMLAVMSDTSGDETVNASSHAEGHQHEHGEDRADEALSSDGESDHDHAVDHGKPQGFFRLIEWVGRFHPVAIHMPIGLLMAGALAELLFLIFGLSHFGGAARYCVVLGALSALSAAPLGWANAAYAGYEGELATTLFRHRWLGTSTAVVSIIAAILSELSHRPGGHRWITSYRRLLFLSAVMVGITGHLGGTLVFGTDYYAW